MPVKMIFLDLDGTLLNSRKEISPGNRAALAEASRRGIEIVPATGRFYNGMPQEVRELPFVRYAVTINGAQVYDRQEKRALYRREFTHEESEAIFDFMAAQPEAYDCFLDNGSYMDKSFFDRIGQYFPDPFMISYMQNTRTPVADFRAFIRRQTACVQKIQSFYSRKERRDEVQALLEKTFPDVTVASSMDRNIEINAPGVSKGAGLLFLCQHRGVLPEETMAFGDGANDRAMLQAAGIGVAMGNAAEELKAVAKYVTETNDRDGVAHAVEKFCLS